MSIDDGLVSLLRRRVDGTFLVDEWGLDQDVFALTAPLLRLRWRVRVEGAEHLPRTGPALIVHNRRLGLSEPFALVLAVEQAIGRHLRPVGAPDVAPVGTVLRWLGGVMEQPEEVAGLLRADGLAAVPLGRQPWSARSAGRPNRELLEPALELGVPVIPAAVIGREVTRRWLVRFGAAGDGSEVVERIRPLLV